MSKFGRLQTEYARRGYALAHVTQGKNRGSYIVSRQGAIMDGWLRFWHIGRVEDVDGAIAQYEAQRKEALDELRMKGRGTGGYRRGARVTSYDEIRAGMLLIDYSRQFDATNLIRVTSLDQTDMNRRIFYWQFVGPESGSEAIVGDQYAMWAHEFEGEKAVTELYLAESGVPS
jgi:hypothetical protein